LQGPPDEVALHFVGNWECHQPRERGSCGIDSDRHMRGGGVNETFLNSLGAVL